MTPPLEVAVIGDSDADMGAAAAAGVCGLRVASARQDGQAASTDPAPGEAENFLEAARRACAFFASELKPCS